ncbi:hypothetical protein ZOSMA_213G00010 [Zostera marina]|uniref:Uncharacterized protein n=1 Tax=Zostera marina TaxID=29655 RepID=A0A0K9PMJ8_ZOSMR|nr:hypothetical protein ZOSMA_213G00010 [Zostera marina]
MEKCRDNVLHRKQTNEPSKLYIDGCVMFGCSNTRVASPYSAYIDNKPYYKKWRGPITYLKEKLDLLEDDEIFIEDISFEKRLNMTEERQKAYRISGTGSSSSTSNHGTDSESKSVEEEIRSEESESEESDQRRRLKGKAVMMDDSKKKTLPRNFTVRMNIVLDRREKQKAEVEAKYEEIFGTAVSAKKSVKPKKKKPMKESVMLRRSSKLSTTSGTSYGLSPDSKYI